MWWLPSVACKKIRVQQPSLSHTFHTTLCVLQVSEESCRAQFLVPVTAQGQNRAQASLERAQNLNPMVEVHADSDRIEDKPDDFFLQFEAVSDLWQMCLFQASKHNKEPTFIVNACQLCTSSSSHLGIWFSKGGSHDVSRLLEIKSELILCENTR